MLYRRAGIRHTTYRHERQLWPLPADQGAEHQRVRRAFRERLRGVARQVDAGVEHDRGWFELVRDGL